VLEEAGGFDVRIGQIAATRVGLLSPEICGELSKLQNRVPAEPAEQIEAALEAELHGSAVPCSPSSTGSRSRPRPSARHTALGCSRVTPWW
jgi:hypothetical protein